MNHINVAIVVIAYNRDKSLERILSSISKSNFDGFSQIPLIISIDKSDNLEVKTLAENFVWPHGTKRIISHQERLGLRRHVISCGDLSQTYENVIILEDDLFVGPYFYIYAQKALGFFGSQERIAGISLYSNDFNELAHQPFIPLDDGFDNYFMQIPCSWGQLWTKAQWQGFKAFYDGENSELVPSDQLSDSIINWSDESWKKFFYKYMLVTDKYFAYPRISHSTNFGDAGTHHLKYVGSFQVSLNLGYRNMHFSKFETSMSKYDAYFEIIPEIVRKYNPMLQNYDFDCDLYGSRELSKVKKKYLLSSKKCSAPIFTFSSKMIPYELNIIAGINGGDFYLGETLLFNNPEGSPITTATYSSKINVDEFLNLRFPRVVKMIYFYRTIRRALRRIFLLK